jgi:hypothetical protein
MRGAIWFCEGPIGGYYLVKDRSNPKGYCVLPNLGSIIPNGAYLRFSPLRFKMETTGTKGKAG